MSVKSVRREWYAANVEPRPALKASDPAYLAWVKRANAHMRGICVPGTATLKAAGEVAPGYTIAAIDDSRPVVVAEVRHVDIAPVTPIEHARVKRSAKVASVKRGKVKTTPLKVPARVAVNALVSVSDVLNVDVRGGDYRDIASDARYLVLAAHPERGFWWLQRFDGATGTMADFVGVRGKSLKVAANGVAAAEYAATPLDVAA